ncbi:MAG: hypothetical protein WKH64_11860 [Chloroflexia bacterium]
MTKFDEQTYFGKLDTATLIETQSRGGEPYVTDAGRAFSLLDRSGCTTVIADSFQHKRVKYYVSSALGFYRGDNQVVVRGDTNNLNMDPSYPLQIRSPVIPVNVLEPVRRLCMDAVRPDASRRRSRRRG